MLTCNCKQLNFTGFAILNAMKTAESAVITKRFPFSPRHLLQWFCFPKLVLFLFHTNTKRVPIECLYTTAPWHSQWHCFQFRLTMGALIFETQAINHAVGELGEHVLCKRPTEHSSWMKGIIGLWGNRHLPIFGQPKCIQAIWLKDILFIPLEMFTELY